MTAFTIRQIPPTLAKRIRETAKKNGQSINKTLIRLLGKSLGIRDNQPKKRDLSDLAGTWSSKDESEFKKNVKDFEKIDPEIWR